MVAWPAGWRLQLLFLKAVFAYSFLFLPQQGWIASSGGAPVDGPGLTCYPYSVNAYTLSFPRPEERADTILVNGSSKTQGLGRFRYAPKLSAAKSSVGQGQLRVLAGPD
jgi:hypothetical protein